MNICSFGDIQIRGWVNEESGGSPTKGIAWCQIPMGRVKYDVKSQHGGGGTGCVGGW